MFNIKNLLFLATVSLVAHSLIINKCIKDKDVALTFEDGPSIKTTKVLLDLLDSLEAKSTFHVVTKYFNYAEVRNLMVEIMARGHVLGYRLEAEWTMQDVSTEGIQGAVDYRLEMIKKATGKKPKFVRTSYNATDLVKNSLLASGLIVTIPNFETYDYKKEFNTQEMMARFDSLSLGSAVTVQREFADNLFDTTKLFVDHLRSKGYKIVTLQECTGIDEIYFEDKAIPPFVTHDFGTETKTSIESTSTSSASTYLNISYITQISLLSFLLFLFF